MAAFSAVRPRLVGLRFAPWGSRPTKNVRGGRLLAAVAIDSLGNGMLFAFQILFLTVVVGLTLGGAGVALTAAQLITVPAPILAGRLVDRVGPKITAVLGDTTCAVGYTGLIFSRSLWMAVLSCAAIQVGVSAYWTANGPLIALIAPPERRVRWFGAVQATRNAGFGVGSALAAVAVAWSQRNGLRLLVLIDILTYLVAAVLVMTWKAPARSASSNDGVSCDAHVTSGGVAGGYRAVLRDRTFLRFLAVNVVFVIAALVPGLLIAVYLTKALHHGGWLAAALLTLNTVIIVALQTSVGRRVESLSPSRVLGMASLLNAAAFLTFAVVGFLPGALVSGGLVLAMVVFTAAEMLSAPMTGALAVTLAPPSLRGRYQASVQLTWTAGGLVAPGLLVGLLEIDSRLPWLAMAALSVLAALLARRLRPGPGGSADSP